MTERPRTLGELRAAGYPDRTVKQELRENLLARLGDGEPLFPGIVGFDDSVLPALERGILAGHDLILLGERGQAKTRLVRAMVDLLDEFDPGDRGTARSTITPTGRSAPAGRRWWPNDGDATPSRLDRPRGPVRREARDARHERRRPDRRRRPDQGGRGALPRRRAHDPLRHDPPHQPRHRGDQRAARPARSGSRCRCSTSWRSATSRSAATAIRLAARHAAGRHREPRRLHAPRADRLAAEGSVRHAGPHALPGDACARRSASWIRRHGRRPARVPVRVPTFMKEVVAALTSELRRSPHVNHRSGVSVRYSIGNLETLQAAAVRRAARTGEPEAVPRVVDLPAVLASSRGPRGVRHDRGGS